LGWVAFSLLISSPRLFVHATIFSFPALFSFSSDGHVFARFFPFLIQGRLCWAGTWDEPMTLPYAVTLFAQVAMIAFP